MSIADMAGGGSVSTAGRGGGSVSIADMAGGGSVSTADVAA